MEYENSGVLPLRFRRGNDRENFRVAQAERKPLQRNPLGRRRRIGDLSNNLRSFAIEIRREGIHGTLGMQRGQRHDHQRGKVKTEVFHSVRRSLYCLGKESKNAQREVTYNGFLTLFP